jgi:hypothetical protein
MVREAFEKVCESAMEAIETVSEFAWEALEKLRVQPVVRSW